MTSFYSEEELSKLNLKSYGKNVLISKNACIYSPENISIGNNVRIDDFCILSGKIEIKDYVHISAGVMLFGSSYGIYISNYCGISSRSIVYAASDDYSGNCMVNSTIPDEYRNVICGPVVLKDLVQVGAGCVVMPNITLEKGSAIGAMSFVNKSIPEFTIYAGIPARYIKERKHTLEDLSKDLESKYR